MISSHHSDSRILVTPPGTDAPALKAAWGQLLGQTPSSCSESPSASAAGPGAPAIELAERGDWSRLLPSPPISGNPTQPPGVLFVVEEGPDAGLIRPLPRGVSLLGRGPHRIQLVDAGASRDHARILVHQDGVTLTPLQGPVRTPAGSISRETPVDENIAIFLGNNRARILPRAPAPPPPAPLAPPTRAPASGEPLPRTPWLSGLGAVAPLAIGAVLWALTGQWYVLLFGLLGLATGGIQCASDLKTRRRILRDRAQRCATHALAHLASYPSQGELLASLRHPASKIHSNISSNAVANSPTIGHFSAVTPARAHSSGLEFASRIGLLSRPRIACHEAGEHRSADYPVASLPAVCRPIPGERIRISGPPEASAATARCVLAAWIHALVVPGDPERRPRLEIAAHPSIPAALLGIPGVRALENHELREPGLLARATLGNDHPVELLLSPEETPAAWTLELAADSDAARMKHDGEVWGFVPEGLSFGALAEAAAFLTQQILTDAGEQQPESLGEWSVDIGSQESGQAVLDLMRDGPHALLAGTTGSGKSELLRTWLLGLAARHSPEQLRLVLIDFKGGATFAPLASLPHVETLVSDLDRESAEHVLDCLGLELTHRERWLRDAGLDTLPTSRDAPPRVVVAIDEFRVLSEKIPEAMARLMHLATVGRSLGLHLILSTQRPQGVISSDLRANVSLTVCLRLQDAADSLDLLGTDAAARLDPRQPGSGLIRRGQGTPQRIQVRATSSTKGEVDVTAIGPSTADRDALSVLAPPGLTLEQRVGAIASRSGQPLAPLFPRELPLAPARVAGAGSQAGGANALTLGWRQDRFSRTAPWTWGPQQGGLAAIGASAAALVPAATAWLGGYMRRPAAAARCIILDGTSALTHALRTLPGAETIAWGAVATPDDAVWATEVVDALLAGKWQGAAPTLWCLGTGAWLEDATTGASIHFSAALKKLIASPELCTPILVGGRELAASALLSACPSRVYFPRAVGQETMGLWPRLVSLTPHEGRGALFTPSGPPLGERVQSTLPLLPRGETVEPPPDRHADHPSFRTLWSPPPGLVTARESTSTAKRPDMAPFAIRTLSGTGITWAPSGRTGVILGGPGLGKSTALAAWSRQAAAQEAGWRKVCPSQRLFAGTGTEPSAGPEALDTMRDLDRWWLIDDVDLRGPDELYALADRVRAGGRLMCTARSTQRTLALMPWWGALDPSSDSLLLGPRSAAEADGWSHFLRVTPDPLCPPGRAWLRPDGEGTPVRVQLVLPESNDGADEPSPG